MYILITLVMSGRLKYICGKLEYICPIKQLCGFVYVVTLSLPDFLLDGISSLLNALVHDKYHVKYLGSR